MSATTSASTSSSRRSAWSRTPSAKASSRPRLNADGRNEYAVQRELRLAVIGTGAIATYLMNAIAHGKAGRARVVALADTEAMRARLAETAARYECHWSTRVLD